VSAVSQQRDLTGSPPTGPPPSGPPPSGPPPSGPPGRGLASRAATFLAVAVASALAAFSGISVATGSKLAVVLPLAAAVAVGLGALALTRFSGYVMAMLVLRASIDLAKLSGRGAGNTATNSAAARAFDPSSILAVVFLLAAALWLAAQHRRQGRLPGSPLRRALIVFAATAALSLLGSANRTAGAMELLRILAAVAMFVVLEQMLADRATMRRMLAAVYLSTLSPLGLTVAGFLSGQPRAETKGDFTRLTGTFSSSNDFGRYLALVLIFGVAMYPHLSRRHRAALAVVLAGCTGCLLLTYTRTALIGAAIGLVVVGLLQSRRLLFAMFLLSLCAVVLVPQLSSRFTSLASTSSGSGPSGNSLEWRLGYWTEVLPLANRNPVTGIGLNMTQYSTDAAKQPHNDFLRAYVETGLIGLGAYLAMLAALVGLGRRAVRASPPGSLDRGVAAGFLGCAVAFVAVSLTANVISNVVNLWYLFTFAAAASAVAREGSRPTGTTWHRRSWGAAGGVRGTPRAGGVRGTPRGCPGGSGPGGSGGASSPHMERGLRLRRAHRTDRAMTLTQEAGCGNS
jgi:putative inorganic carbon (HCO3(-)) transporter